MNGFVYIYMHVDRSSVIAGYSENSLLDVLRSSDVAGMS
jgi:hypothetical protein